MASKRNTIVFRAVYGCVTTTTKIMIQIKKIMVWKFLSPWNVPLCRPFTINSFPCQPLANTNLLSVTAIFFLVFSRISCKWNHTACDLLCLTSFIQHTVFFTRIVACIRVHSFLSLCTVPLYKYNSVYPFFCWWIFELSSVLAILNKAAIIQAFLYRPFC